MHGPGMVTDNQASLMTISWAKMHHDDIFTRNPNVAIQLALPLGSHVGKSTQSFAGFLKGSLGYFTKDCISFLEPS